MVKTVLTYPKDKEGLTIKSSNVDIADKELPTIIQDLKDTLHNSQEGVGISAIQIGIPKKICIVHYNNKDIVMINPVITKSRGEQMSHEGCLSVPRKIWRF